MEDQIRQQSIISLENKIDKLDERLVSIDITLAAQHECLKDHIRRTTQLETALVPIKSHVDKVQGAVILLSMAAAVLSVLHYLGKV